MTANNKPLFLIVGRSGSGKTTIVEHLEKYKGFKPVQSYTDRKKRSDDEYGHIFVSEEEFDKLENIVAYAKYDNHRYCATKEQIDESDLYVVDPVGVEDLLNIYKNKDRDIYIIYINVDIVNLIDNMKHRGDSDSKIVGRIKNDFAYDWESYLQLIYTEWKFKKSIFDMNINNVELMSIDGNQNLDNVLHEISCMIVDNIFYSTLGG